MKTDIRAVKMELRRNMREYRTSLSAEQKSQFDSSIAQTFYASFAYKQSTTVLTYVSTAIEVDTIAIIEHALSDGKRVACPRCVEGTFQMEFFYIDSLDELSPGTFGVLEPQRDESRMLTDYADSVCVVPGLSFDYLGYRLGYGKGYYDRFLSNYTGSTVGLCYSKCISRKLPHGRFDRAVDQLITEAFVRRCNGAPVKRKYAGGSQAAPRDFSHNGKKD